MRPLPADRDDGPEAIDGWLPHRGAMRLVDRVTGFRGSPDPALSATFEVRPDHVALTGHFPGDPIWPGALTIEGLAQASMILLVRAGAGSTVPTIGWLTAVDVKLLAPVRPPATLTYRADATGSFGGGHRVAVEARVGRLVVARGTLSVTAR